MQFVLSFSRWLSAVGCCVLSATTVLIQPADAGIVVPPINLLPHPVDVSSGAATTCALISDGTVDCWGANRFGQAGASASQVNVNRGTAIQGLNGAAKAIAVGGNHSCALLVSGEVQCWGINDAGQLGVATDFGSVLAHPSAATVIGLNGQATAIAAGQDHTCAVVQTAAESVVKCWGNNNGWELGINSVSASYTPILTPQSMGAMSIAAGREYTCALMPPSVTLTGTVPSSVKCWGVNVSGELGIGAISPFRALAGKLVQLAAGVLAVHAGSDASTTCALVAGGTLHCWGHGDRGQLGSGLTLGDNPLPVTVQGMHPVSAFSGSGGTTCMVSSGAVFCWGLNDHAQLGNPSKKSSNIPVPTLVKAGASAVAVGSEHVCAIVNEKVECWGGNDFGQLGDGTFDPSLAAVFTLLP